MEIKIVLLYLMAVFYMTAGIAHFTKTKFFVRIVPPFLPWKKALVYISGVAAILCTKDDPLGRSCALYGSRAGQGIDATHHSKNHSPCAIHFPG